MDYFLMAKSLKALADPSRLKIVDLLSCGSLCACDILDHFEFSQPTLSHHMRVLQEAGIIESRKEGKWQHYSLNAAAILVLQEGVRTLFSSESDCVCHSEMIKKES